MMTNKFDFTVKSGKVNLSDPCYSIGTPCGAYDVPAKNGEWHVELAYSSEGRVASWVAYLDGHKNDPMLKMNTDFGVDSGQFGIFDVEIYDPNTEYGEPGFYGDACDITLAHIGAGTIYNHGFVSRTGWGDGFYDGFAAFENDELVKFSIDFMYEDNEDDGDF